MYSPASLIFLFIDTIISVDAQFIEPPLQFAGFAAINVPVYDNNVQLPSYPYNYEGSNYQNWNNLQQSNVQIGNQPYNSLISLPQDRRDVVLNPIQELVRHKAELSGQISQNSLTEQATYLSLVNDKDNFQSSGCGWDFIRMKCHDLFGLCKGGCNDFAIAINSPIHDCRCVPYGYSALLKLAG